MGNGLIAFGEKDWCQALLLVAGEQKRDFGQIFGNTSIV